MRTAMANHVTCDSRPGEALYDRLVYGIRMLHLWGVLTDADFQRALRKLEKLKKRGEV